MSASGMDELYERERPERLRAEEPRIICTKCPAVAELVHSCGDYCDDRLLVAVRCHGEQLIGLIDNEVMSEHRASGDPLIMQSIRKLPSDLIHERIKHAESLGVRASERVDVLRRFTSGAGMPVKVDRSPIDMLRRAMSDRGGPAWTRALGVLDVLTDAIIDAEGTP